MEMAADALAARSDASVLCLSRKAMRFVLFVWTRLHTNGQHLIFVCLYVFLPSFIPLAPPVCRSINLSVVFYFPLFRVGPVLRVAEEIPR